MSIQRIDNASDDRHHFRMPLNAKSAQLQIRVSTQEKAAIRRSAKEAGLDISSYVLQCLLPPSRLRFQDLCEACTAASDASFALAELNGFLSRMAAGELRDAVEPAPGTALTPFLANYISAMVEAACELHAIIPPRWTAAVPPLENPYFGSNLVSLRLYLLSHSPPPFRRRNIFIDAGIGTRV
jgi:hypothetical protein